MQRRKKVAAANGDGGDDRHLQQSLFVAVDDSRPELLEVAALQQANGKLIAQVEDLKTQLAEVKRLRAEDSKLQYDQVLELQTALVRAEQDVARTWKESCEAMAFSQSETDSWREKAEQVSIALEKEQIERECERAKLVRDYDREIERLQAKLEASERFGLRQCRALFEVRAAVKVTVAKCGRQGLGRSDVAKKAKAIVEALLSFLDALDSWRTGTGEDPPEFQQFFAKTQPRPQLAAHLKPQASSPQEIDQEIAQKLAEVEATIAEIAEEEAIES